MTDEDEPVGIGPLPRCWCEYCRREIIAWRDGFISCKWGQFHQRCAEPGVNLAVERNHRAVCEEGNPVT
jgi:hypothetical protein